MDELIEAVAEKMAAVWVAKDAGLSKLECRALARAAISETLRAIREPTPEMIEAADHWITFGARFMAAIDTALQSLTEAGK